VPVGVAAPVRRALVQRRAARTHHRGALVVDGFGRLRVAVLVGPDSAARVVVAVERVDVASCLAPSGPPLAVRRGVEAWTSGSRSSLH
jgi:hypothetical protein